jgi:hypothetical protein
VRLLSITENHGRAMWGFQHECQGRKGEKGEGGGKGGALPKKQPYL